MAQLIIQNLAQTIVQVLENQTILKALQLQNIDFMQACGGRGRCTTCKIHILEGEENLSSLSPVELKFREQSRLKVTERLACQCYISGQVSIFVPRECQLPHLYYTS